MDQLPLCSLSRSCRIPSVLDISLGEVIIISLSIVSIVSLVWESHHIIGFRFFPFFTFEKSLPRLVGSLPAVTSGPSDWPRAS